MTKISNINIGKITKLSMEDSEIRYRRLFEAAQDGIIILDARTGMIEDVNPYLLKMLGYSREEFIKRKIWEVGAFKDIEANQDAFESLQENEYIRYENLPLKAKDGKLIQVEFVSNVYMVGSEKVIQCNIRDITERKKAEDGLRKIEDSYLNTLENMKEGFQIIDYSWRYHFVNNSAANQGKRKKEELLGYTIMECYPGIEKTDLFAVFVRCMNLRVSQTIVNEFEFPDGTKRWFEFSIQPSPDGIFILSSDITERRLSDETLQKSEKRFRAIIENSLEEISMIDSNGNLTYESPSSSRPLGYPPNSLIGHNLFDLFHPDERYSATQLLKEAINHPGSVMEAAFRLRHQDGSWRWMEGSLTNLLDEPAVQSIVINYRDVTERKQNEEKILNSNNELSMLFNLSKSLAKADNLDDILNLVNHHAVESVHTTFGRIALFEGENYIMRAGYPLRPLDHDLRLGERNLAASLPYVQQLLEQNKPMIIRASDPGISNEERKALLLDFAQALYIIPLRISDSSLTSDKLMGLLMLGEARNEGREPFTPEKMRLAQTIGSSAAIAIRRMLLREQTERRLQQLIALSEIDLAIISSSDMDLSLGILLLQAMEQLKVDAADVWIFNPTLQTLEFVVGRGFQTPAFTNAKSLHLGEGNAGRAALERRTIHIPNLGTDNENPRLAKALKKEPFIGYYAVPLIVKNQLKGVLEFFHRNELESNEDWLNFLNALANQAAIAIDNSSLFNDLQKSNTELTHAYNATILGWSRALDLRDNETEGHTQRVTELTIKLGRQFGLSEEQLVQVRRGALLHDIGKMGVPDGILLKPGPLTEEEWVVMKKHTTYGYELLTPIHFLQPAIDIPYCHHEKWDGTGYPRGLKGDQIPFVARIFAVVDVWDALTSDRPYRAAWSEEKTLDHIRSLSGTHFDPQIVNICLDSGLLQGHPKMNRRIEPFQWTENFSVGVRELDQQHQQLFKLVNRMISATGTESVHSETISDFLEEMTRYAQTHFTTEERLMEAYSYPGLEKQMLQHNDFCKKTAEFKKNETIGGEQNPEALLKFLTNWLSHHILEDDMKYRSFFREKGVE